MSGAVEELKSQADAAVKSRDYETALARYTELLEQDAGHRGARSNRSLVALALGQSELALQDADYLTEQFPEWPKSQLRRGNALLQLGRIDDAIAAYETGMRTAPGDAKLAEAAARAQQAKSQSAFGGMGGMGGAAGAGRMVDQLEAVIQTNDEFAELREDAGLKEKLDECRKTGNLQAVVGDPRIMPVLQAMLKQMMPQLGAMGADFASPEEGGVSGATTVPGTAGGFAAGEGAEAVSAANGDADEDEDEDEDEEMRAERLARKAGNKEKALGTAAYRARDFAGAHQHFQEAVRLWAQDPTYLFNDAAVYLTEQCYDKATAACLAAIETSAEYGAPLALRAKMYARLGLIYERQDMLDEAIEAYSKSLLEMADRKTRAAKRRLELRRATERREAYLDPALALEAKERGDALARTQKWGEALLQYEESLKRNPKDARIYLNRSTCFQKMARFPQAIEDIDRAIELDPRYVKAIVKKITLLIALKNYVSALRTVQAALRTMPEESSLREAFSTLLSRIVEADGAEEADEQQLREGGKDPEIQALMSSPMTQQILTDLQSDPSATREHLRNPQIIMMLAKLQAAGVIRGLGAQVALAAAQLTAADMGRL